MVVGGVLMLLVSLVLRERIPNVVPWQGAAAWAYLVVFGSITGFTAYSWLLAHTTPPVAMSYAYVNPVIAVALGALLGHEGLSWQVALATVLIGGGVMVALGTNRAPPSAAGRAVTSRRTEP
jgi:drug/metabolite transporter (DMT)-like permease